MARLWAISGRGLFIDRLCWRIGVLEPALVRRPTKKHLELQLCKGNALKVVRANPGLGQGIGVLKKQRTKTFGTYCDLEKYSFLLPPLSSSKCLFFPPSETGS